MYVCVCVYVYVCVRACVRACVCVCVGVPSTTPPPSCKMGNWLVWAGGWTKPLIVPVITNNGPSGTSGAHTAANWITVIVLLRVPSKASGD